MVAAIKDWIDDDPTISEEDIIEALEDDDDYDFEEAEVLDFLANYARPIPPLSKMRKKKINKFLCENPDSILKNVVTAFPKFDEP